MEHNVIVRAIIIFVETHIEAEKDYAALERDIGFSLSHIRSLFAAQTGRTLARYVQERKVAHAAFDLVHSRDNILHIAFKYGFRSPDTFTRAFFRHMGVTPQQFRKERTAVGAARLYDGIYGIAGRSNIMNESMHKTENSTVLYGVPRVGYGAYGGVTPYPICVKGVANYLGDDIDYSDIMVVSGAAFRLTWDRNSWFGGNVDICFTFDNYDASYRLAIEGLGRSFTHTPRKNDTPEHKQEFIQLIRENIDAGIPCIAMGIIGPPEACVITGYRDGGNTLLGWNFFQDRPEYAGKGVRIDESGYFVTDAWWENGFEQIITLGRTVTEPRTPKQIIGSAIEVLTGRNKHQFAKGIWAYDAWKNAIIDDTQFPPNSVKPLLVERMVCQGDAMGCLADGRHSAKAYFEKLGAKLPEHRALCRDIAAQFGIVFAEVSAMSECLGGWGRDETQLANLNKPDIRRQIGKHIDNCQAADEAALALLQKLYDAL